MSEQGWDWTPSILDLRVLEPKIKPGPCIQIGERNMHYISILRQSLFHSHAASMTPRLRGEDCIRFMGEKVNHADHEQCHGLGLVHITAHFSSPILMFIAAHSHTGNEAAVTARLKAPSNSSASLGPL